MANKLRILQEQLITFDRAPLLPAAAKAAMRSAVELIADQANQLAVVRARLDAVEARAADALGRAVKMEGAERAARWSAQEKNTGWDVKIAGGDSD